ncbi:hypothetical protein TALC_00973 [Thermoplasmatales archaeon BRNA1]|nr:hypothetical protein TALC_00973 [Thermoplasmatales archaeon BRNA1]
MFSVRKSAAPNPSAYLNEGPETVGMMTAVLGNGGSLDAAIREVASDGPPLSRRMFRSVTDDADTRVESDMRTSLRERLSALPEGSSSYGMAMHMVISASDTRDTGERERMLKDASDIALQGLREAGKSYSSSLNVPCMTVFGVGIMIPMVLMSVLPMLGMSGLFGSGNIDPDTLTAVTVVIIPMFVMCVISGIRGRNPFLRRNGLHMDMLPLVPLVSSIPVFMVASRFCGSAVTAVCVSAIVTGACMLVSVVPEHVREDRRRRQDAMLQDAVFDMGNRLMSGMDFADAFLVSVSSRNICRGIADAFRNECSVCRGDMETAISNAVSPVSSSTAEIFCRIYRVSLKDIRNAGKLALSLGRQLKDQESVRKVIRSDLRSMTDTMFGTAAVFAPLVLGMSVSMLGPLSRVTEGFDTSGTSLILSVYLVELCALIAVLVSVLEGKESVRDVAGRFAFMLPISMAVFLVTTGVQL